MIMHRRRILRLGVCVLHGACGIALGALGCEQAARIAQSHTAAPLGRLRHAALLAVSNNPILQAEEAAGAQQSGEAK